MNQNIGSQLRKAREERALSLEQVSQTTHMRMQYLQAIEAGDFEAIPSMAQARGFVRKYATYLGLDAEALLVDLDGDEIIGAAPEVLEEPVLEVKEVEPESAEAIFIEVGERLKQQREILGLSLDDIERHTNLRPHYLIALEAGDLGALPSPVQGRGMLNNYATFLGMDPEPVMIRFAQGLQTQLTTKQESRPTTRPAKAPRRSKVPARMRRIFSGDILVGGILIVFLVSFVIWGAIRIFAMGSDEQPSPTAPSIAEVLLATPSPTTTPLPAAETPTSSRPVFVAPANAPPLDATVIVPANSEDQGGVQIYMSVLQRAWVRVLVDGEIALVGRVLPGSAYSFSGDSQVEILTGNGIALQVFYNQQDQGRLGGYGQVVHRIYTIEGILLPTPTITPTATATPRVTPTVPVLPGAGTGQAPLP